ncbi:MAG: HAMP domain-containing protein [archaeon]
MAAVKKFKVSLSAKLLSVLVIGSVILMSFLSYFELREYNVVVTRSYQDKATSIAYALDANVKSLDELDSSYLLSSIYKHIWLNSEITEITVNLLIEGKLTTIASNNNQMLNKIADENNLAAYSNDKIITKEYPDKKNPFLRVITPIHVSGKTLGTYQIDISMENAQKEIDIKKNSLFLAFLVSSIIFVSVFYLMLRLVVLSPINKINAGLEEIAKNNLEYQIRIKSNDEFEQVATSFNNMTQEIKISRKEQIRYSKWLEQEVTKKTKELQEKLNDLEKFQKITINRELKMIELKKQLNKRLKEQVKK